MMSTVTAFVLHSAHSRSDLFKNSHFTEEEIEAERENVTSLRPYRSKPFWGWGCCVGIDNQVCLTLSSVLFPLRTWQSHARREHSALLRGPVCGLNHRNVANNSNDAVCNCSSKA